MTPIRPILSAVALAGLAACAPASPPAGRPDAPQVARLHPNGPPGAGPGTCWAQEVGPARTRTLTRDVLVLPARTAPDGAVLQPPVYRTETVRETVPGRPGEWFETPCANLQTPDFIASLQRALAARGLHDALVTGEFDAATRAAVRRYQAPLGIDSDILSLEAARKLGLVTVETAPDGARPG